jgi:hypothetical protein
MNYIADVYDTNCQIIDHLVISSSGINGGQPITLTMFYIASNLSGNVVRITATTYDAAVGFPTINLPYYNNCLDAYNSYNG